MSGVTGWGGLRANEQERSKEGSNGFGQHDEKLRFDERQKVQERDVKEKETSSTERSKERCVDQPANNVREGWTEESIPSIARLAEAYIRFRDTSACRSVTHRRVSHDVHPMQLVAETRPS